MCCSVSFCVVCEVALAPFQLASVEKEKQRWEKEKSQLKASIEENKERMLKLESYWIEAQTLCHTVNEHLKEAQAQYQALEKKYNKAKKLIKDFQQKWVNLSSPANPNLLLSNEGFVQPVRVTE